MNALPPFKSLRCWTACLLLPLALLGAPTFSHAQEQETPTGSVADMLFKLTLSQTVAGTFERDDSGQFIRDGTSNTLIVAEENTWTVEKNGLPWQQITENITKIQTFKYSNREFLQDLVRAGLIASIEGWSIKRVVPTENYDGSPLFMRAGAARMYLVHKDPNHEPSAIIELDSVLFDDADTPAQATNDRQVIHYSTEEAGLPVDETRTYTQTYRRVYELYFNLAIPDAAFPDIRLRLTGVLGGSTKLQLIGPNKVPVMVSGATRYTYVNGDYVRPYEDDGYLEAVVQGECTFSAGKPSLDLSAYPDLLED